MTARLVLTLAALACTACVEPQPAPACGPTLAARVDAVGAPLLRITERAEELRARALEGCAAVVTELGGVAPAPDPADADATLAATCDLAARALDTATAELSLAVAAAPPSCAIDLEAQLACEAACDLDAECPARAAADRCPPPSRAGGCPGECLEGASCESVTGPVTCAGPCDGICEGDCSGTMDAAGRCDGDCAGPCEGACAIVGPGARCGGRCVGGCADELDAPVCRAPAAPPECALDPSCVTACRSLALFGAACAAAALTAASTPESEVLTAALAAHVPGLLTVREEAALVLSGLDPLIEVAAGVGVAIAAVPACSTARAAPLGALVERSGMAAASIQATLTATRAVTAVGGGI